MPLLYNRHENEHSIKIEYKYYAAWYIVILLFLFELVFKLDERVINASFVILIILSFAHIVGHWKANSEIRKAMKHGKVEVSGSKFSFKKPLTFVIKKH